MAKRKKPAAVDLTFTQWRDAVLAELNRREIPAAALDGHLSKLYITRRTPEQAAAEAEIAHYNSRPAFRIGRRH